MFFSLTCWHWSTIFLKWFWRRFMSISKTRLQVNMLLTFLLDVHKLLGFTSSIKLVCNLASYLAYWRLTLGFDNSLLSIFLSLLFRKKTWVWFSGNSFVLYSNGELFWFVYWLFVFDLFSFQTLVILIFKPGKMEIHWRWSASITSFTISGEPKFTFLCQYWNKNNLITQPLMNLASEVISV